MPQDAVQLPALSHAQQVQQQIYNQVFFHKLAEFKVVPQSQAEAVTLLGLRDKAAAVAQSPEFQKKANRFAQADAHLDELMKQAGVALHQQQSEKTANDAEIASQLALSYASDPEVYKSMLAIGQHTQTAAG